MATLALPKHLMQWPRAPGQPSGEAGLAELAPASPSLSTEITWVSALGVGLLQQLRVLAFQYPDCSSLSSAVKCVLITLA